MGEIVVEILLENVIDLGIVGRGVGNDSDVRRVQMPAIADTGAMMLALPQDVVDQLGLSTVRIASATYADGRRGDVPVAGPLNITIGNRFMTTECVVIPQGSEALIGQIVMEGLDLIADCAKEMLSPRPESPDRPMLRL